MPFRIGKIQLEKAQFKKTFENMVKNDFQSKYKPADVDGQLAYYEGEQLMFDTTTAKHLTPADIIKKSYGAFISPDVQQPKGMGLGTQTPTPKVGKMTKEEYYYIWKDFTSRMDKYEKKFEKFLRIFGHPGRPPAKTAKTGPIRRSAARRCLGIP